MSAKREYEMDPQVYARKRFEETRPTLAWKSGSTADMRAWQTKTRRKIRELIGGVSGPRTPLHASIHEVREFPQYRRETVRFESRPGLEVFAYLLTPVGAGKSSGKTPAVLCLPGHGRGVDSIVGIAEDGS
jgi:hypothetical protein